MRKVFNQTDKTFASNGDVVIDPRKAIIRCKDNDDFFLELETGLEYADYMTGGRRT